MRVLWTVLLLAMGPTLAQDADALVKRANQIERKAETLLDQGKRAQAFALLAQAADLREQAKKAAATSSDKPAKAAKTDKKKDAKAAKAKDREKTKRRADKKPSPRASVDRAIAQMDRALQMGDMQATAKAAKDARRQLVRWSRALAQQEKTLVARGGKKGTVPQRVAALERQVEELRRLLDDSR